MLNESRFNTSNSCSALYRAVLEEEEGHAATRLDVYMKGSNHHQGTGKNQARRHRTPTERTPDLLSETQLLLPTLHLTDSTMLASHLT